MIIFHRKQNDPKSEEIEEKLTGLVLAYETVDHSTSLVEEDVPFIEESGKKITGPKAIEEWLIELEEDLNWQRSLSGDACYVDPKTGEIC